MLSLRGLVEMAPPRVGPGLPQAGVTSGASTLSPSWVPRYRKAKDARCGCHLQPQGAQERRGGRRGCCAGHEGGALARCTEPPPGRPVTARTSSAAPSTHVRLCRCDPAPFRHRWRGEVGWVTYLLAVDTSKERGPKNLCPWTCQQPSLVPRTEADRREARPKGRGGHHGQINALCA